jgi:two-component system CheB/CheR fusion protein
MDVLSCRNMLIYLEPDLQQRVLALLHYALLPEGLLFLGSSESLGPLEDAFTQVDKKAKIFAARETRRNRRLPSLKLEIPSGNLVIPRDAAVENPAPGRRGLASLAERALLSHRVPPSVLITAAGSIAYIHGRTGRFLEPVAGEPNANLFEMAREGLRLELPAAVREAIRSEETIARRGLQVKSEGGFDVVDVHVSPLSEPETLAGLLLVTFERKTPTTVAASDEPSDVPIPSDRIRELETELQHVRENLQGTIEELETSNEELKSTNEELQSTNEELQSANEELETSREEMQSMNEELQTLNSELQDRNDELSQSNDDMQNLLNSTDVATVFLDGKLRIKRFTEPAKKVFHLRDTDLGRPLADMAANLRYADLMEDAQQVLRTLVFTEKQVATSDGDWRLMRILPYRTGENVIDGLIVTFLDIDPMKKMEQRSEATRAFTQGILAVIEEGVVILDEAFRVESANAAFCRMFGISERLIVGESLQDVGAGHEPEPEPVDERHLPERRQLRRNDLHRRG